MKAHSLATLAIRLVGLHFMVRALVDLPIAAVGAMSDGLASGQVMGWFALVAALKAITQLLAGLTLIGLGPRLAKLLVPGDGGDVPLDAQCLLSMGLGVLGCLFAIEGAQGIVREVGQHFSFGLLFGSDAQAMGTAAFMKDILGIKPPQLAVPLFTLGAGLFVLVRAGAISRWWGRRNPSAAKALE